MRPDAACQRDINQWWRGGHWRPAVFHGYGVCNHIEALRERAANAHRIGLQGERRPLAADNQPWIANFSPDFANDSGSDRKGCILLQFLTRAGFGFGVPPLGGQRGYYPEPPEAELRTITGAKCALQNGDMFRTGASRPTDADWRDSIAA